MRNFSGRAVDSADVNARRSTRPSPPRRSSVPEDPTPDALLRAAALELAATRLSPRVTDVFVELMRLGDVELVAEACGLSPATVQGYRREVLAVFGADSMGQLRQRVLLTIVVELIEEVQALRAELRARRRNGRRIRTQPPAASGR